MIATHEDAAIRCPIDLFSKQEAEIARLTTAINRAPTAAEKAPLARALVAAVDVLLACERYDEQDPSCRLCRNFSTLRKKTGTLIVKAARLGG